jgi:hypothetical protein
MIHWDNRETKQEIRETMEAMATVARQGLQPGLSGLRHPESYAALNKTFGLDFRIEVKHHLWHSDIDRYSGFQDKARFLTYGINAGGVKLDTAQYHPDSNLLVRGGSALPDRIQQRLPELIPAWNKEDIPQPITTFNQIGMINA